MKKLLFLMALLIQLSAVHASNELVIEDSCITKNEYFEVVKKWIATTLDSYDATISYEDKSSGCIVVKGSFQDKENYLMSKILRYVIPYVLFQLEVQCDNGKVVAQFKKIAYTYEALDVNPYGLSNEAINKIIKEFEAIKSMTYRKGSYWVIDDAFEQEYQRMESLMTEAKRKMDDDTLPRKERRTYKNYYENNNAKYKILDFAVKAKKNVGKELLTKDNVGLCDVLYDYLYEHCN